MQITILSVAAKPQQFFEKKKKKIHITVQSQISELWSQGGKKYLCWSMWFLKPGWKIPAARNQEEKAFLGGEEGVVAGMLSTPCGSMMCCLLGQRHPWDWGFLGGTSWWEAALFAWLLARGDGERTSWCHSVEWRGLLCSLSPCKVPCRWAFLWSRRGERVSASGMGFITGGVGIAWAHTAPPLPPLLCLLLQGPSVCDAALAVRWLEGRMQKSLR